MLPPIRCFTCGKVVADQYDFYLREVQRLEAEAAEKKNADAPPKHFEGILTGSIMDKLGLKRYCCRRMMLGIEDMMEVI